MLKGYLYLILITFLLVLPGCSGGSLNQFISSTELLTSVEVTSSDYDATTVQANIRAQIGDPSKVLPLHQISFYSDDLCKGTLIGSGLVQDLAAAGIPFSIPINQTIKIYFQLNTDEKCNYLSEYTSPLALVPTVTFTKTAPESPSRTSLSPAIYGLLFPSSGSVEIYSDSLCTVLLGSGSKTAFANDGIALSLQAETANMIYAKAKDLLGQESACSHFTTYTHTTSLAVIPQFLSAAPASPQNISLVPKIKGSVDPSITNVKLYSEASCNTMIGSGSAALFESDGIEASITADATTHIYAQTEDAQNLKSNCVLLTSYIHDSVAPAPPAFVSALPVSPTRLTTFPKIKGTASVDTQIVRFYNSATCLSTKVVGWNTRTQFVNDGINANLSPNMTTAIYAASLDAAGNISTCVHLTDYRHNTIPPGAPTFATTDPVSPNNQSLTPLILGSPAENSKYLNFYSDDTCTTLIGRDDADQFELPGILLTVPANTTTDIYANAEDAEGNLSECSFLSNYMHSTAPANNVGFSLAFPSSPTRVTANPFIIGTADSSIVSVEVFSDASCSSLLGSGTRAAFVTAGIQIAVPTDATTQLYARSRNTYGNYSSCSALTAFTHTTQKPMAPTLTLVTPLSPNNITNLPVLNGNSFQNPASPLPPIRVVFYDGNTCVSNIGEGSPTLFSSTGIQIVVPENMVTTVYARSFDAAFNASDCTFITNYTYNNLLPGRPIHGTANPNSPSYTPYSLLKGTYATTTDFMDKVSIEFFSDASCTQLMASGSPTQYTSTGIGLNIPLNAVTSIFAKTYNEVGNQSACTLLINYRHSDVGATNPSILQNANGALRLNWSSDLIASPTPTYNVKRSLTSNGPYTVIASGVTSSSYLDSAVNHNQTYFYRIQATNTTGSSQDTSEVSLTVNSPNPTSPLTLTALPGPGEARLNWTGSGQNMTYKVERATQSGGPYTRLPVSLTGISYNDYSLVNGLIYYYRIIATNPFGESISSNEASVSPLDPPTPVANIWLSPKRVSPACSGNPGLHVFWTPTEYSDSYEVWRIVNGSYALLTTTTQTEFADCNPNGGNWNRYFIIARWGTLGSAPSAEVIFRDSGNLNVIAYPGNNHVLLTWGTPASATSYDIYTSDKADGPFILTEAGFAFPTYTDSTLPNGQGRFYTVQARNGTDYIGWPSLPTGAAPATDPTAPWNLTLAVSDVGESKLEWSAPDRFNRFIVYRSSSLGGPYDFLAYSSSLDFTDSTPSPGMNYYRVSAQWGNSQTAMSNIVSMRKTTITGLTATRSPSNITLNWGAVAGISDYRILRATVQSGPFATIAFAPTATHVDSTASAGVGYYYRVQPRFADLTEGQRSNMVGAMLTGTTSPTGLSVLAVSGSTVQVGWISVPGATNYRVRRSTNPGGPFSLTATVGSAVNNYIYGGLISQTQYYFQVGAMVSGIEQSSAVISQATLQKPDAPSGDLGNGVIALQWTPIPGATDYTLERSTDLTSFSVIGNNLASSTFTDSSVVNGQIYYYRLTANYPLGSVQSDVSAGMTPGRTPIAPAGLHISDNSISTSISLAWAPVTGSSGYYVYMSTVDGGPYGAPQLSVGTPMATVTGLTPGTNYYFVITTRDGNNESAFSAQVSATASSTPPAPLATYLTTTQIQITWSAVAGAATYDLERSEDGLHFIQIATGLAGLTYTDSSFAADRSYSYRFRPVSAGGFDLSLSAVSSSVFTSAPLLTPLGLTVSGLSSTSVDVRWVPVPTAVKYEVYRSLISGAGFTLVQTVTVPTVNWIDSGLSAGTTYYYYVRAINISGVPSNNSPEQSISLTSAPTGLAAVNNGANVDLSWNAVGGAVRYQIYRATNSGGPYGWLQSPTVLTATDTQVIPNTNYYYIVRAEYASGVYSLPSSEVSVLKSGSLKFQVPIEMIDRGVASHATSSYTFNRSLTRFNSADYDGTVSYTMEIVATNTDSSNRNVQLLDSTLSVIGTISVPASTNQPLRLEAAVTMPVGSQDLKLRLAQTTDPEALTVFSAKLLVNQENATKTRIYYPLAGSSQIPTSDDETASVTNTFDTLYQTANDTIPFRRQIAHLSKLTEFNAWSLDALVQADTGTQGQLRFLNTNSSIEVPGTQTWIQSDQAKLAQIQINEGVAQFSNANENNLYDLQLRCQVNCQTGQVRLLKAGLWVRLENLTKLEIPFRTSLSTDTISFNQDLVDTRTRIDLSRFSSPSLYFQATATTTGNADVYLSSVGTNDQGTGSITEVPQTRLSFSSGTDKQTQMTYTPMTINSNDRFLLSLNPMAGFVRMHGSMVLIRIAP